MLFMGQLQTSSEHAPKHTNPNFLLRLGLKKTVKTNRWEVGVPAFWHWGFPALRSSGCWDARLRINGLCQCLQVRKVGDHLVIFHSLLLKMAMSLYIYPPKKCDFPVRKLLVYQRVMVKSVDTKFSNWRCFDSENDSATRLSLMKIQPTTSNPDNK